MLSAYRTFAATAAIMGVTEEQVEAWVEGPLVARVFDDGTRLIHHEDLIAFRRPLSASAYPGYSALCKPTGESSEGGKASPHPAAERDRGEATATAPAARHLRLVRR